MYLYVFMYMRMHMYLYVEIYIQMCTGPSLTVHGITKSHHVLEDISEAWAIQALLLRFQ